MSQPHHKEDDDGCNQHPGSTGIIVAEVEVQLATFTGRLRWRQSTLDLESIDFITAAVGITMACHARCMQLMLPTKICIAGKFIYHVYSRWVQP